MVLPFCFSSTYLVSTLPSGFLAEMVHLPSTLTGAALGRGSWAEVRMVVRVKRRRITAAIWYLKLRVFILGSWDWCNCDFWDREAGELIAARSKKRRQDAGATDLRRRDLADMGRSNAAPVHELR